MRLRVLPVATVAALAGLVGLAPAASAHVTVSAPDATQGGYTVLTFQVPTETDTASTTGLRVQLPVNTPFASVQVQPLAGWTFATKQQKLANPIKTDDGDTVSEAVSEIDWAASSSAAAIKPGEFQLFRASVGPPSAGSTRGGGNTGAVIVAVVALVLAAGAAAFAGAAYRSSRKAGTSA